MDLRNIYVLTIKDLDNSVYNVEVILILLLDDESHNAYDIARICEKNLQKPIYSKTLKKLANLGLLKQIEDKGANKHNSKEYLLNTDIFWDIFFSYFSNKFISIPDKSTKETLTKLIRNPVLAIHFASLFDRNLIKSDLYGLFYEIYFMFWFICQREDAEKISNENPELDLSLEKSVLQKNITKMIFKEINPSKNKVDIVIEFGELAQSAYRGLIKNINKKVSPLPNFNELKKF